MVPRQAICDCQIFDKKGHIKRDYKSNENGPIWNSPQKSTYDISSWVTKKHVVSATKYSATATTTRNRKKYKWFMSCNSGNGLWVIQWKYGHKKQREPQKYSPIFVVCKRVYFYTIIHEVKGITMGNTEGLCK